MSEQNRVLTVTFGTFSCTLEGFDDPFPVLRQIADYFQALSARDPSFGTQTGTVSAETLAVIGKLSGGIATPTDDGRISVEAPRAADRAESPAPVAGTDAAEPAGPGRDLALAAGASIVAGDGREADEHDISSQMTHETAQDAFAPVADGTPGEEDALAATEEIAETGIEVGAGDIGEDGFGSWTTDADAATDAPGDVRKPDDPEPFDALLPERATLPDELHAGSGEAFAPETEEQDPTPALSHEPIPDADPETDAAEHAVEGFEIDRDLVNEVTGAPGDASALPGEETSNTLEEADIRPEEHEPVDAAFSGWEGIEAEDNDAAGAGSAADTAMENAEAEGDAAADRIAVEAPLETEIARLIAATDAEEAARLRPGRSRDHQTAEPATSLATDTDGAVEMGDVAEAVATEDAASDDMPEWETEFASETNVTDDGPGETPATDYGSRTVRLNFGQVPGLDQSREVSLSAPLPQGLPPMPALPEAVNAGSTLFDETEDTPDNTFVFSEAPTEEPATVVEDPSGEEMAAPVQSEASPEPLILTPAMSIPSPHAAKPEAGPVLRLVEPVTARPSLSGEAAIREGSTEALREFAARAGAATLPDLLEASAAYVTLVSGRPSFSRGEIMRMVDTFEDDGTFSQEARIKSFGALIRGGRIHRTDTGDFEISRAAREAYERASIAG